jgi:hypothetical protein
MRTLIDGIRNAIAPRSCPVPPACPSAARRRRLLRLSLPLLSFVVPTVVTAYAFVIPRSCIHGVNALSVGFATTVLGACITYVAGVRAAAKS